MMQQKNIVELMGYAAANDLYARMPVGTELVAFYKFVNGQPDITSPCFYKIDENGQLLHWVSAGMKDLEELIIHAEVYTVADLNNSLEQYPSLKVQPKSCPLDADFFHMSDGSTERSDQDFVEKHCSPACRCADIPKALTGATLTKQV